MAARLGPGPLIQYGCARDCTEPQPDAAPDERPFQPIGLVPTARILPAASAVHKHRSVGSDRRVWLEAFPNQAATMRLHAYCVDCGAVRSERPRRGRSIGFFAQAVANLKMILEYRPQLSKLAQVQAHLILKSVQAVPDFDDPYSMPFDTQWSLFLTAVQRVRPDIDLDLVQMAMPREPRQVHARFIDVIAQAKQEVPLAQTPG